VPKLSHTPMAWLASIDVSTIAALEFSLGRFYFA
jgi:hypothetical protein